MKPLTKYPFIKATECEKSLWLNQFRPELKSESSEEDKAVMEQGKEIGILARQLYSGGVDISQGETIYGRQLIEATKNALKTDQQIFYEAAFETIDRSANFKADLFIRCEKATKLIEVKSATYFKDDYLLDLAFQYYVLMNSDYSGPRIQVYIAYINNKYIRGEQLEIGQLFTVENITPRVIDAQVLIKNYLFKFAPVLTEGSSCPTVKVSKVCTEPNTCTFYKYCWKDMPGTTVLDISRINKNKAFAFIEEGKITPEQLTHASDKLSENQWIEVDAIKTGKPRIDSKKLKDFLKSLELDKPTFWMDFESFMRAAPEYIGTKPYQQICFQYCVIYRDGNGVLERREFLAERGDDPRKAFLLNLLKHTEGEENIIVYHKSFEINRLNELAKLFPEFECEIEQRVNRIVDLETPFSKKYYYHPMMNGSASLKSVLPCLVKPEDLSYKNLVIQNGSMAMNAYLRFHTLPLNEQILTRRALIEYCHVDVLGMVKIAEALLITFD